jgi:hypothetical protein
MPEIIEIPTADNAVRAPLMPVRQTLTQQQIALLSASHYGWCPYDNIELMGPTGLERKVAYDEKGDFVTVLPRSELLLFENIETRELSAKDNNIPNGPPPLLEEVTKYAAACVQEVHDATYGEWGFVVLHPLTGLKPEKAFLIFSVIQPLRYDLAALDREIRFEAKKRIAQALAEDKEFPAEIAEQTRRVMLVGTTRAIAHARTLVHTLRTDMATFQGTKQGKSFAYPGDEHAFAQLHEPVPSPLAAKVQTDEDLQTLVKLLAAKELRGGEPTPQEGALAQALASIEAMRLQQEAMASELAAMRAEETARREAEELARTTAQPEAA